MKRIAGLFITATIASFTTIAIYKTFDNYKQSDGLIINDTRSEPKNIFHYANPPHGI